MTSLDSGAPPGLGPRLAGLVDALFGFEAHPTAACPGGCGGTADGSGIPLVERDDALERRAPGEGPAGER